MQIVIPMSGFGERFRRAGYTIPKPLIEVDGKPMFAHVVDLFPGETRFVLVCNADHLAESSFDMRGKIERFCPTAQIVAIPAHRLGPVHAVAQALPMLDPDQPVIVNYCDFSCYWDYEHFRSRVTRSGCDGAVPAYRGFHPHSLGAGRYAYIKERDGRLLDIAEKQPFTTDPMNEFASSGTYYFKSAELLRHYCSELVSAGLHVGGEFYVSMLYRLMARDGCAVSVYELQHFMQWGTPEDLREYEAWSRIFRLLVRPAPAATSVVAGSLVVPMAGLGSRFVESGYTIPKPLIKVSGREMVVQAVRDLPRFAARSFVARADMEGIRLVSDALADSYPGSRMVLLPGPTDGQARTCLAALDGLDMERPLTIAACDTGLLYSAARFERLLADDSVDVIVWVAIGHPAAVRHPRMYGWIERDGDDVVGVSVKRAPPSPEKDPLIVGTFTFKRAEMFRAAAARMIERDARVNGELYVDTCIEDALALGFSCRIFVVDGYMSWGTPDELRTFEYWQSCFSKLPSHPYALESDPDVPREEVDGLKARYAARVPA